MPIAQSNGLAITYQTFGNPEHPPLLLIMGLGAQMLLWPEPLCQMLTRLDRHVIRFDNRDIGESSRVGDNDVMALLPVLQAMMMGQPFAAPYTLSDMADDTVGLLDALGYEKADIVGASMGGMIAQTMAIDHPSRVRTLTSIMSTTGDRSLPQASPEILGLLMRPAPRDRAGAVESVVNTFRAIGGKGYPFEEEQVRQIASQSYDRGTSAAGLVRQILAINASGSRRAALHNVKIPTLVIHGDDDPLVLVEGGRDTAASIPGARLVIYPGMGHDMPTPLWPEFIKEIGALMKGVG